MKKKIFAKKPVFYILFAFLVSQISFAQKKTTIIEKKDAKPVAVVLAKDSILAISPINDSIRMLGNMKLKLHQKNAHASYYADKFSGRRTASGKIFNNNEYTCAHKKLPFGTKLKVTNEVNNKSVFVTVTDRGPFVRGRFLDLSKRAFMDIVSSKGSGKVIVTIEIISK